MKRIFFKILTCILIVASLFSACAEETNLYADLFSVDYSEENEIFYNYFGSKLTLLTDPTEDFNRNEIKSDIIQYPFLNNNSYYTSGSSTENNFKIIKVNENEIETLYEMPNKENEALFPLDEYNGELYFIKTEYYDYQPNNSRICVYRDNNLVEFSNTKCDSILSGTIIDDIVYYISYNSEKRTADIFKYNLANPEEKPMLFKADTKSSFLYRYNGEMVYNDDEYIYAGNRKYSFDKSGYVSFVDDKELMIKSSLDGITSVIQIYNLKTGELIEEFTKCEGLRIDKQGMKLLYSDKTSYYTWGD